MNYCYVTLISSNYYLMGAIGLYYMLRKYNSKYDFIIMCTKGLDKYVFDNIKQLGIKYIEVDDFINGRDYSINDLKSTINKGYMFSLTEYDKVCFLDADIIIADNIDSIFELNNNFEHCGNTGTTVDGSFGYSCGIMIVKPSLDTFNKYVAYSKECNLDTLILRKLFNKANTIILPKSSINITGSKDIIFHSYSSCKYWDKCLSIKDLTITIDTIIDILYINICRPLYSNVILDDSVKNILKKEIS